MADQTANPGGSRSLMRAGLVASVLLGALSACVTEQSGGIPGPAPDSTRIQAHLDLARGYLEQRDWPRARKPIERALAIDPSHVESHVLQALLYHAEDEVDLAEEHYLTALQLEPDNSQALNNYGSFLYAEGRYRDALEPLGRLVQNVNYRARPQAFENLGLAYVQTGNLTAARSAFERALGLNYRSPRASLELADIAYQEGALAQALQHFDTFNRNARPTARSLCMGLKLAVATENADEVASYGLALKNLYPDQADQCQTKD